MVHTESLLLDRSAPRTAWTTVNIAEAMPGLQNPMAWSVWSSACEKGMRQGFRDLGLLSRAEVCVPPSVNQRIIAVFHGYGAINVDTMRSIADRTPGSSGDVMERQLLGGAARPDAPGGKTYRRYPVALFKAPLTIIRLQARLRRFRAEIDPWWSDQVRAGGGGRDVGARFREAVTMFERAFAGQMCSRMIGQALYDEVRKLAESAGKKGLELRLVTGYGGFEESEMVDKLWDTAHGEHDLDGFLARYGYRGPAEGNLASRSWREDPAPVETLLRSYRRLDASAHPGRNLNVQIAERERAEAELLAALSGPARLRARLLLKLARRTIPLGEVGKTAFLKALDGVRAAARDQGGKLVAAGAIAAPDDVFLLTPDEAFAPDPGDLTATVAARRETLAEYAKLRLPTSWLGQVEPLVRDVPDAATSASLLAEGATGDTERSVSGAAAAPGIVEGYARVITDVDDLGDLEPDEILVCHFTDPSWASYMPVASAFVIDIGSPVSHGAILAREFGLPCVIGTGNGTTVLRTGDHIRVDGSTGTVTVTAPTGTPQGASS